MGERDAFGREIGEDTLADVGWRAPEPARTQPPPQWTQPPKPAPTVFDAGEAWAPRIEPKRRAPRPRRRRGFSRLIFLLALLVIVAAGAGSLMRLGEEAVDRGQRALRDAIPTAPSPVAPDPANGSLLRPAALRDALARLPEGRVAILTLRPNAMDAAVIQGGKAKVVHLTADGELTTVDAPAELSEKSVRLDPAAPGRIIRTVARRTGRDPDEIGQLVLANGTWFLEFPDGVRFTANAKGTKVRRLG